MNLEMRTPRDGVGRSAWPAVGGACAFALLLAILSVVAPSIAPAARQQGVGPMIVASVASKPLESDSPCEYGAMAGQLSVCAFSAPAALPDGRSSLPVRHATRSGVAMPYDITLAAQSRESPPDRPPRFAA